MQTVTDNTIALRHKAHEGQHTGAYLVIEDGVSFISIQCPKHGCKHRLKIPVTQDAVSEVLKQLKLFNETC